MTNLAIFCSGSGSNAQKIMEYFKDNTDIKISVLMANKPDAFALERAKKFNIPTVVFNREDFYQSEKVIEELRSHNVSWIILAGFLWLIPESLVKAFPGKIINIHPALLPKYGGKGMYGHHVHQAVADAKEKQSGMTIHYVNEKYDEGNVIFQAFCDLSPSDTADDIALKVLELEHKHYPVVIEKVINN